MTITRSTLELLRERLKEIEVLEGRYNKSNLKRWHTETKLLLEHIFGEDSEKVKTFDGYDGSLSVFWSGESEAEINERYKKAYFSDLRTAKSYLKGLEGFLSKILHEPTDQQNTIVKQTERSISEDYTFHPVIAEVANGLFADGHYKDAVRSAFIEVIFRVKQKTKYPANRKGDELDGDDLMNQTFSFESRTPRLQWNHLKTKAEKDFQQGMFYLFKGVVALRNEKGHLNVEQKDRQRAFEYLCFASLLMRQLDDSDFKAKLGQEKKV